MIFDIDGTLLQSMEADCAMFVEAIRATLGDVKIRPSWADYRNVSDSGILAEIMTDNAIDATDSCTQLVRARFVDSLECHLNTNGSFSEIPGALNFVSSAIASKNHAVAYATGCWSTSAALKLGSAKFPLKNIPLASADDHMERVMIMRHALDQLGSNFESVTYYGDGSWDQLASSQLGWRFVPVGPKLGGLTKFPANII